MKRYILKKSRIKIKGVFKVLLIIILSVMAIKLGTIGGDILFRWDKKIIRSIDVENYRSNLKATLPIIDTIYNSGNVSVSLTGYIKDVIQGIFHFDMTAPLLFWALNHLTFSAIILMAIRSSLLKTRAASLISILLKLRDPIFPRMRKKIRKNPHRNLLTRPAVYLTPWKRTIERALLRITLLHIMILQ